MTRTLGGVAAAAAAFAFTRGADGCTIVAAGRDASSTGSPLVSHTDDSGLDTTDIRLVRVPRRRWPAGSTRKLYNWADGYPRMVAPDMADDYAPADGQLPFAVLGEIPQVEETLAYWDMDYGVQNEAGLSIGESTSMAKTAGWPAVPDKPYGYNLAGIEDLSKIALERCATARCACQLMGDIAVEHGFYSADSGDPAKPSWSGTGEALAVADSRELWVFNIMTGRNNASSIWAAQQVPPDHVAAVGNSFTIRHMDLTDSENFLFSPGVQDLAVERGWWDPSEHEAGTFDFMEAYGYDPAPGSADADFVAFYTGRRMWRIFSMLSPVEGGKLDPNKGNMPNVKDPYPISVRAPRGSVAPSDIMSVLRDHYENTTYDLTVGMAAGPFGSPNRGAGAPVGMTNGLWERAISMHRTSWSYVLEARPNGESVTWFGYDAPHGTAYLPFFGASGGDAPDSFHSREGCQSKFSHKVAWWAFNFVNQYTDLNFQLINKDVRARGAVVEAEGRGVVRECLEEAKSRRAARTGHDGAGGGSLDTGALTRCSNRFAEAKVAEWWEFAYSLLAKFGRSVVTQNESGGGEAQQRYPAWWVEHPDVGYTLWTATGGIADRSAQKAAESAAGTEGGVAGQEDWRTAVAGMLLAVGLVVAGVFRLGEARGKRVAAAEASAADGFAYRAAP